MHGGLRLGSIPGGSRRKAGLAARIGGALAGEAVMVAGYFAYEGVVLGFGLGAAAAIPGNLIQGVFGLAVSVAAAGGPVPQRRGQGTVTA